MSSGATRRELAPYGWAVACVAVTQLVRVALDPFIGAQTPFVVLFFFPVIVGAWRGGVGPALVAALLGVALGDRVSMDPGNGVPLAARVVRVGTFLLESWFVAWLFESREAESRARSDAEAIQRTLLEHLPKSAVLVFDRGLRFLFAAGRAVEDAGLTVEQLLGRTHADFFPEEEAARAEAPLRAALAGRMETAEFEVGGKTYLVHAAPLRDARGEIDRVIMVSQEITERKDLERELREVQKLEAVGKLAGGVAHDFNNVLGVITASVDLLQAAPSTSGEQRRIVRAIDDAVVRAVALTQQLLDFSRRQVLQTEELEVSSVLRDVGAHLANVVGGRAELAIEQERGLPTIEVNRLELERAIVNLVTNARDAMTRRGSIRIRTRYRPSEITDAHPNAGEVCIEVVDDGVGMDQATLAATGKRFFTTKGRELGTGLGLSVVRSFVGSNRGRLEIESELGVGSTFRMVLPASIHRTPVPGVLTVRPPQTLVKPIRVLVVDDEDSIRSLTVQFLAARGFLVDEARDAETALESLHPDVEVVITDLFLPGMSGLDFGRKLRELLPNVRLVLVSGSNEIDAGTESLVAIRARFLPKPFHLRDLAALVESLSGPPNSEEIALEEEMFEARRAP